VFGTNRRELSQDLFDEGKVNLQSRRLVSILHGSGVDEAPVISGRFIPSSLPLGPPSTAFGEAFYAINRTKAGFAAGTAILRFGPGVDAFKAEFMSARIDCC
jgi:hypothetical protein